MKIYSQTTITFAKKAEGHLKNIIENETHFNVRRSRFEFKNFTYPIHVVIFQNDTKLGYFDPHTYQIGLNQNLIYSVKEYVLKDILRHELAHYINFITNGPHVKPHGNEFKKICFENGWEKSISKATMDIELENEKRIGNLKHDKVMTKIKALLKLAQSDNIHEAQLATVKANQLLIKYNIEQLGQNDEEEEFYSEVVFTAKRKNSKLIAIYDILKHFLVRPVLIYGQKQISIEVSGSLQNIELADYVASFLDHEMDRLWDIEKKINQLKGLRAKNSFYHGLAKGYDSKMQSIQNEMDSSSSKQLILIQNNLDEKMKLIYRRLSHTQSQSKIDSNAFNNGISRGKNLTINQALKNKSKNLLLGWRAK